MAKLKAIISHRIYLEVDNTTSRPMEIMDKLTYKILPEYRHAKPYEIRTYLKVKPTVLSIPVGRTDLIDEGILVEDRRVLPIIEDFPEFKHTLRPSQQEIYNDVSDNCIINAKVGWGKTFTALAIAGKFKTKTLILVHTSELLRQWVSEVEKAYGFTPDTIGSGKYGTSTPIVVAMVQTATKRITELSKLFGLVVMDEVHHVPSDTFARIVDRLYARYKIGISGTLTRKDKKHVLIFDYFSNSVYTPKKENTRDPEIHLYDSGIRLTDSSAIPWATKVTKLLENDNYYNLVVALARKYSRLGHKVLIVADRVEFLQRVSKELDCSCITGDVKDVKQREKQISRIMDGDTNYLCGSQKIFSEGVSVNPLSCLILVTPVNNDSLLDQLCGRVMRNYPDKLNPVIVDLALEGNTGKKQRQNRLSFYAKQGWDIVRPL